MQCRSVHWRSATSPAVARGCRAAPVCPLSRGGSRTLARPERVVAARALQTEPPPTPLDSIALKTIEDLDTQYCDDFQCTSSPAIETTVRSLARELTRGRYATTALFQPSVTYSDGFRSFSGLEGYTRQRWVVDNIVKPKGNVVRMRMLDKGTSQIEWRVTGKLGPVDVDITTTTVCTHNLLTGRVETQRDTWSLKSCAPPAAALATLNRYAWSAKQGVADAREAVNRAAQKLGLGGGEEGGQGPTNMSDDPTRFYQQGGDQGSQDIIAIGFLIALLYLGFQLFKELETLG